MNNLWRKTILCVLLCGTATITHYFLTKKPTLAKNLAEQAPSFSISRKDSTREKKKWLLASQRPSSCQSLNEQYEEFYNFETRNYHISICLKGEKWFYYRESKSNPNSRLLIPATVVFGGDVFKAVDGKVTYFVGVNSDGYYSSVMYGNNQMIFEPELSGTRNTAIANREETMTTEGGQPQAPHHSAVPSAGNPHGVAAPLQGGERLTSVQVSSPETIDLTDSELSTGYWKVCTEDRDDLHPYLNGWQQFIGKSPQTISEYASTKGHNFSYSDGETGSALVETTDGLMVTLDIVQITETIGSVCVKPIASF